MGAPSDSGSTPAVDLEKVLGRHGPKDARDQIGSEGLSHLASASATSVTVAVVVGDLRMSGLLIREAVSLSLFARYVVGFTEAVRSLANEFDGWFDKFTGDGFVAFWIYREEDPLVHAVAQFCRSVAPAAESLISNLKKNSRNFPVGVGLSLGIDSGPCELVRVGDALTIVGSPIVGATRMVSGANAGQTLVNVALGSTLERHQSQLESVGIRIEKRVVPTKEYPQGQEAYELTFARPPSRDLDRGAA